ncbi:MAG: pantetheine-phosphate adenylyltransferase [Clostridium sp.]|uniref:pantetheine-phosphate adenylyltransferase n=1 Tax=Clostridium sp. TaxID=1506 RepID=UPI002FC800B4
MNKIAVYPGSFDPITNGHLDIIQRSAKVFDKLIVAVLENPEKKSHLFNVSERVDLIKKATSHIDNIEVESFMGLLVNYVESKGANIIVRGLRAISDFEYEFQMTLMNRKLSPDIETFFMMTKTDYSYLSSSAIKQVAYFGGSIEELVPECIIDDIYQKIKQGS